MTSAPDQNHAKLPREFAGSPMLSATSAGRRDVPILKGHPTMPRTLDILLFAFGQAGVNAIRSLQSAGHRVTACFTHPTEKAWIPSVADECDRQGIPCSTDPAAADISLAARPDVVLSVYYQRKIEMPY